MRRLGRALALLALLAPAAAAEPVPEGVWCGDDYWFEVDPPSGWNVERQARGEVRSLIFEPASGAPVGMDLKLLRAGSGGLGDVVVDVEDVLQGWISVLNVSGAPSEIRSFRARHPHLPTAGATLDLRGASASVVAIDTRSGRGNAFVATLARQDGAPSPAEIASFRRMIASIDFDPRRACAPDPDGEGVVVELSGPDPAPPAAPATGRAFDLEKAASGCATLGQLLVPLTCRMLELEGQRTLLAFFDDDGTASAQTYLERFRDRVAVPFCYESRRYPDGAPQLVFHAEHGDRVHLYDCAAKGLQRSLPASALRP